MKHLKITVDGKLYDVTVEEINDSGDSPFKDNSERPSGENLNQTNNVLLSSGEPITAPMSGNIISINVSVDQVVKKGDVIAMLEAMKMENEILSPRDGKIVSINAQKGQSISVDQVIAVLE